MIWPNLWPWLALKCTFSPVFTNSSFFLLWEAFFDQIWDRYQCSNGCFLLCLLAAAFSHKELWIWIWISAKFVIVWSNFGLLPVHRSCSVLWEKPDRSQELLKVGVTAHRVAPGQNRGVLSVMFFRQWLEVTYHSRNNRPHCSLWVEHLRFRPNRRR